MLSFFAFFLADYLLPRLTGRHSDNILELTIEIGNLIKSGLAGNLIKRFILIFSQGTGVFDPESGKMRIWCDSHCFAEKFPDIRNAGMAGAGKIVQSDFL